MLLKIQGYDYNIQHRPGKELVLADTLSRLPNPKNNAGVELDIRVDEFTTAIINISANKQHELRNKTTEDSLMNELKEIIYEG